MAARQNADPAKTLDAVHAVEGWLPVVRLSG